MIFKVIKVPFVLLFLLMMAIGCLFDCVFLTLVTSDSKEDYLEEVEENLKIYREMTYDYLIKPFRSE